MIKNRTVIQCSAYNKEYIDDINTLINVKKIIPNANLCIWNTFGLSRTFKDRILILNFLKAFKKDKEEYKKTEKELNFLNIKLIRIDRLRLSNFLKILFHTTYCFFCLNQSIKKLKKLEYKGVSIGKKIHESFLRISYSRISFTSPLLFFLIFQNINAIENLERINSKYSALLTKYTCYSQWGLAANYFNKMNKEIYSVCRKGFLKKHRRNEISHQKYYKNYKEKILKNPKKNLLIERASKKMKLRFSGGIDDATYYMKESSFHDLSQSIKTYDGCIFLHDFTDSFLDYGDMIFDDLIEWAEYSLDIITKNNLNICIKPHPNAYKSGERFYEDLSSKYKNVDWISKDVSNKVVFSKINFGVSVWGSVLQELGYHGIPSIAVGENLGLSFKISSYPKDKKEYMSYLKNPDQLLSDKKKIIEQSKLFYAAHLELEDHNIIKFG